MEYRDWDDEESTAAADQARNAEMNSYSKPAKKSNEKSLSCHYCGCEATDFDFFGAPICDDCR